MHVHVAKATWQESRPRGTLRLYTWILPTPEAAPIPPDLVAALGREGVQELWATTVELNYLPFKSDEWWEWGLPFTLKRLLDERSLLPGRSLHRYPCTWGNCLSNGVHWGTGHGTGRVRSVRLCALGDWTLEVPRTATPTGQLRPLIVHRAKGSLHGQGLVGDLRKENEIFTFPLFEPAPLPRSSG